MPNSAFFNEEISLNLYRKKLHDKRFTVKDARNLTDRYHELLKESSALARISDRLGSRLENTVFKIRIQNNKIKKLNSDLHEAIDDLKRAKISRKATAIMYMVAIGLFISEEFILDTWISANFDGNHFGFFIKVVIVFGLKFFESTLEKYFLKMEHMKVGVAKTKIQVAPIDGA